MGNGSGVSRGDRNRNARLPDNPRGRPAGRLLVGGSAAGSTNQHLN